MFRFPAGKRNISFKKDDCMEKALEFLKTNKEVAFATVEGDKPKIRVFFLRNSRETRSISLPHRRKRFTDSCRRIRM